MITQYLIPQVSPVNKRPIAGYINICPDHGIASPDLFNVLTHHLFHIMGISRNLFDSGAGSLTHSQTLWGASHKESYRINDVFYVGVKSMDFVKNHFQCEKGYGVLLENQDTELV